MKRTVVIILLLTVFSADSEIITVSGQRCTDIQFALNKAAHGDTVFLPEGNYLFRNTVNIHKEVYLKGSGAEKSRIQRSSNATGEFWFITVDGSLGRPVRISGLGFYGNSPNETPGIRLQNEVLDFRIDNCVFKLCNRRAIEIRGGGRGVIDNNKFIDNWPTAVVIYGKGDEAWDSELALGSENAVFVEDNYFVQNEIPQINMAHHIASNNGSRYVFRYNKISDGQLASHSIDAHGNKFYWPRGSRSYEIYENIIKAKHRWAGINIRGGDGVIFNNRFYGSFVSPIHLMHESNSGDGNCVYPCEDQIRKLYIWGNVINGDEVEVFVRHPEIVKENRDYKVQKLPGYKPYTYPHPLRGEE
ncbi:glycosyl hydrolase family 28-related protein [Chitinispirillales bacterium ANBcel5]|uniref:right-handed parallel beta-helix repeat-containing protein n=1 Tax=Cellulosispirillum alkaliphilum TaxID=3039283 RepID=UPI002A53568D|nr:glycosyl hydrolase family 28-related protein [Chitinispirillales bacterium ANBcel5]